MRKIVRALLVILVLFVLIAGVAAGYVYFFLPNVGAATDIKIEATPQRIERGKYLAEHVAVCIDCHSTRDWSQFSGPMVAGTYGKGGDSFPRQFGFPGIFYARNITPYGIGKWTDGEVLRAVAGGVSKDGSALFPLMPYQHYGVSDKEDVYSIIAYIRSLPPVKNDVPRSDADFPVNVLMHLAPAKPKFSTRPPAADSVRYGEYLVTMASCMDCHSQADKGEVVKGTEYGGGREFIFPGGTVRSANITTHNTGLSEWTRDRFIGRFKAYQDTSYHAPKLKITDYNSPMPWMMYGGMTEPDLAAIYAYLRTVKPIENKIEKFTPKKI
jgi:mono/diheme cytochrome c family protein